MDNACIDLKTLSGYIANELTLKQRKRVEKHLSGCDYCLETFVLTRKQLKAEELHNCDAKSAPRRMVSSGNISLETVGPQFMEWNFFPMEMENGFSRYANLRGSSSGDNEPWIRFHVNYDSFTMEFLVIKDLFQNCRFNLYTHMFPNDRHEDAGGTAQTEWVRLNLNKNDLPFASRLVLPLNEMNGFEKLEFGAYALDLHDNSNNLKKLEIDIGENGIVFHENPYS